MNALPKCVADIPVCRLFSSSSSSSSVLSSPFALCLSSFILQIPGSLPYHSPSISRFLAQKSATSPGPYSPGWSVSRFQRFVQVATFLYPALTGRANKCRAFSAPNSAAGLSTCNTQQSLRHQSSVFRLLDSGFWILDSGFWILDSLAAANGRARYSVVKIDHPLFLCGMTP
jgi:hypothetical protein